MSKVYSDENGDDFTVRRRAPSVRVAGVLGGACH
jgi:hypothetical protein